MRITPENLYHVYQVSERLYRNKVSNTYYKLMPKCPICGEPFLAQCRKRGQIILAKTCSQSCGHKYLLKKTPGHYVNQGIMKLIEKDLKSQGIDSVLPAKSQMLLNAILVKEGSQNM